jgi:hypothetical protein
MGRKEKRKEAAAGPAALANSYSHLSIYGTWACIGIVLA